MKKVIVALSGGVDSSVSALLLKQKGYEVIGLFMKNWHDDSVTISNECPWLDDSNDAMLVAQKLDIPFQTIDLSKEYQSRIIDYMFKEYESGRTPNPDILCNREIKFDIFLKVAINLGADYIATGHYCRVINNNNIFSLLSGIDKNKDQSYFLCQLNQYQLSKVIFPIGCLKKSKVRELAKKHNLVTANKKDSQGLCFVGKVKLPEFLKQRLSPIKGEVVKIPNDLLKIKNEREDFDNIQEKLEFLSLPYQFSKSEGEVIGNHSGAHFFTIGQRKGLNIGGYDKPLFVLSTDIVNNIVYVGMGDKHLGLYKRALFVKNSDIHWIREDLKIKENDSLIVKFRIRYRQPLKKGTIYKFRVGLYILFDNPMSSVTPGQFVTWYIEDELIGSGIIS